MLHMDGRNSEMRIFALCVGEFMKNSRESLRKANTMTNPCDNCSKPCIYPDCFALKVWSTIEKRRKEQKEAEKRAKRMADDYRYSVIARNVKRRNLGR